jgi:hypothetical protein
VVSMENTLADIEIRQFVFETGKESISRIAVRPTWPIVQVILGGLLCAYLTGWVQDLQRIRDLRAEPVSLVKVVVTKQEAWERIHAPRPGRRSSASSHPAVPTQLITFAAIDSSETSIRSAGEM